jgi:hypothetical protein
MTGPDGVIDYDPNTSGACSERSYAPGTVVELTAHAAQGRQWSQSSYWSGTDNNSANPTTVTMNGERSVKAYFTENQSDTDGFSDPVETYLGADPLDACPDDPSDDAWPLDIDMDGVITVVGDAWNYRGRIGAEPGNPMWWQRLDLDADGVITVVDDVFLYVGMIGETCTD